MATIENRDLRSTCLSLSHSRCGDDCRGRSGVRRESGQPRRIQAWQNVLRGTGGCDTICVVMIKSFRLTPELEGRLEKAAARAGVSVSDFIREAVEEKCEGILGGRTLLDMLGDTVGAVEGGGNIDSSHTGREFADLMVEKY